MSRQNLEMVRRIYDEQLIDEDPGRLLSIATPDIEFVNPSEAVESGIRRGRSEVARALQNASDNWDSSRHELDELFDCGDSVVAAVRFCTRSRGSSTEVVQREAHTWTIRDGRIARFEWGRSLAAALDAAEPSQ